jgi:UDP-N-acetylenolpyruvoylglucosamine reductase
MDIQHDVAVGQFFTMKLKATAASFCTAKTAEDLQEAVLYAHLRSLPIHILGGGSNTILDGSRIEGLVIKNMYHLFEVLEDEDDFADVRVSSGYPMTLMVQKTGELGFEGMEYQKGLPGTVGGAIYMNSKWTKPVSYVGDHLVSARLLGLDGTIKTVDRDYFEFAYDYSILQETQEIVLDMVFTFKKADPAVLKKRSEEAFAYRNSTQPIGVSTSGCVFQNVTEDEQEEHALPTRSAGYLIDQAGLKGYSKGGFTVSDVHANFIINSGSGKPEELHALINHIEKTVKKKFGITLEKEVRVFSET